MKTMRVVTGFRASLGFALVAMLMLATAPVMASQPTPWQLNFQEFVTPVGVLVEEFHNLLLVVEFGMARQDWLWDYVGKSPSGVFTALEKQVIQPSPPPTILVMGSSRIRDGIAPRTLEGELGLTKGQVMNTAVTNGTGYDALTLYRRNRQKLSQAKLIILGVEDWYFNASYPPSDRDRRYMTLEERTGTFNSPLTLSLLAGWVWRTYDARGPFRDLLKSLIKGRAMDLPVADDGRIVWREKETELGPDDASADIKSVRNSFYRKWEPTLGRKEHIAELTRLATEDGVQVFVIQLPWRQAYLEAVKKEHAKAYAYYRQQATEFPGAQVRLWEGAAAVGVPENHFYDYGHPTIAGATSLTRELANDLRARYPGMFLR